ncbi:MAG: hypothetical protein ACLUVG_08520 [Phocaeicola vulgatus]
MWSVGGTWKLSNESFFNVDWIDRLNVRASYGISSKYFAESGVRI